MKKFNSALLIFLVSAVAFMATVALLRAQLPKGAAAKGFQYAWHDPKDRKPKAIFSGATARQVTGSQLRITEFGMKILRDGKTNAVELIAQAPGCLFDLSTAIASSAGPVKAYTATTNFYIEGVGFFCQQSNRLMIISNQVHTTINKGALNSKNGTAAVAASNATNRVEIFADYFRFHDSNIVTYTGNVRVEDLQAELTCDLLNILLTTNNTIQQITADDHVVIVNKKDKSRATGEQAVYTANDGREIIELLGHPFWSDGEREGTAEKFIFDRTNNLFRAEQNAVFKVPRDKIGQLDLLAPGAIPSTNAVGKLVVISSDLMTFKMPPTNGPIQEMIAEKNVVILSESDESRATARRAVYQEATGLMELTGDPEWKIKGNEIKAEILVAGRTNQFFGARTNVYLKIPAVLFGKLASASGAGTNAPTFTNQIVEVFADDFAYVTNLAIFRENVRAKTEDANGSKTTLLCSFLDISFGPSNQVQRVVANKNVFLRQILGPSASSRVLEKSIACDLMMLNRSPQTGLLEKIHAENKVIGEQIEREKSGIRVQRILAEIVDVKFLAATNQIESIIAQNNVMAERILKTDVGEKSAQARGERAAYSASEDVVELTGKPSITAENVLFHEATLLRWNLKTGKISGSRTPYKVTPLNSTNKLNSIRIPKKP